MTHQLMAETLISYIGLKSHTLVHTTIPLDIQTEDLLDDLYNYSYNGLN